MALTDCERCWDTPCTCGYSYETWETPAIQSLADVLQGLLARRAAGEPRRRASWETATTTTGDAGEWSATLTVSKNKLSIKD